MRNGNILEALHSLSSLQRVRSAGIGRRTFVLRHVADVQNSALSVDCLQKVRSSLGLPHLLDQPAPAREHLHEPGDDGLQQRVKLFVGERSRLDEGGCAIGAAPLHPVQH